MLDPKRVGVTHPDYAALLPKWRRCRDAFDGGDAVKARGKDYLPVLDGMTNAEYEAYKDRALFYNATSRTIIGLSGVLFRKDPAVKHPPVLDAVVKDATLAGVPLPVFALEVAQEVLKTGRFGVLVDMPANPSAAARGFLRGFVAESIVYWREQAFDGVPVLTELCLASTTTEVAQDGKDEAVQTRTWYWLEGAGSPSAACWSQRFRFRKTSAATSEQWIPDAEPVPMIRRGAALPLIPFVFVGPSSLSPEPSKPPMLDLVDVNLSHYRSSADLEHGRHLCALPTPWIAGVAANTGPYSIGPARAWVFTNENVKVGMLEFTGQGLGSLERALVEKEKQMGVLGARLLEGQKAAAEAAATVRMRYAGDDASLKTIAVAVSEALSRALALMGWWMGAIDTVTDNKDVVDFALSSDFYSFRLDAQELQALVAALNGGGISFETFYYNLQRGDIARPGVDAEAEAEDIKADGGDTGAPGAIEPDAEAAARAAAALEAARQQGEGGEE